MNQLQMNLQNINKYNLQLQHTFTLPLLQGQHFSQILSFLSRHDTLNLWQVSLHLRNIVSTSNYHLCIDADRKDSPRLLCRMAFILSIFPRLRSARLVISQSRDCPCDCIQLLYISGHLKQLQNLEIFDVWKRFDVFWNVPRSNFGYHPPHYKFDMDLWDIKYVRETASPCIKQSNACSFRKHWQIDRLLSWKFDHQSCSYLHHAS
jgi:hypothetical protein